MSHNAAQFIEWLEAHGFQNIKIAREYVESASLSFVTDIEAISVWLDEQANLGDVRAQHALGVFYIFGVFGYRHRGLACKWSTRAAEQNYGPALFLLAAFNIGEPDESQGDESKRLELLKKAEQLGYGPAARLLATEYEAGVQLPHDDDMAKHYYERAVELGDAESMFLLSIKLRDSTDANDVQRGASLLENAAALNDPGALNTLARFYESGIGGYPKDAKRAVELSKKAELIQKPLSQFFEPPGLIS